MLVFDGTVVKMDELRNVVDDVGSLGLAAVYAPVRDEFHEETPRTLEVSGCAEAKEERKVLNSVCEGCRFPQTSCHCGMSTSDSTDDDAECVLLTRIREMYARKRENVVEKSEMKERVNESAMNVVASEMKEPVDESAMEVAASEMKEHVVEEGEGAEADGDEDEEVDDDEEDGDDDGDNEDDADETDGDDEEGEEISEEGEGEARNKESTVRFDALCGAGPGSDGDSAAPRIVSVSSFPMRARDGDIYKLRQRFLELKEWVHHFLGVPNQDTLPGILPMLSDELSTIEFLRSIYRNNLAHVQSMNDSVCYGDIDALKVERRILTSLMRLVRLKQGFEELQSQITRYIVDRYHRE